MLQTIYRAQPPQFRNKPQSIPVPTQAPTTTRTTTTTRRTTTRRPTPTTTFAPAAAAIITTPEAQELNTEFNTEAPEILSDKLVDIIDTIEEVKKFCFLKMVHILLPKFSDLL